MKWNTEWERSLVISEDGDGDGDGGGGGGGMAHV